MLADLGALRNRQMVAQMRFAALRGRSAELLSQKTKLVESIGLAKARIELAPQVTELFNFLQEQAHARSVGQFEDLLSAFVADVIPDAGRIQLELGTERGAPALDILLDNAGNTEDILEGNGGGLTNVVVTALTYAAQSRAGIRPLVVLDEPDCWLKASCVPAFTRVIAEVANPVLSEAGVPVGGCQTLMISHNDIGLMDEGAHILELRKGATGPEVVSLSGSKPWVNEAQVGLRWIEVENLRAHKKTRVHLSPGLNVLAGNVNLGKSTLFITALRAIAYGDTNDTMISHGGVEPEAPGMAVRVGIENGITLEVVRNRKGSPKVVFRRYEHGKLTNESRQETRAGVPEFVSTVLQIVRVDDLDIQLRSQKEPVFLLNEPAATRARLLSVGKESGLLQNLIEGHRLELRRDRESLKTDEVALNAVNKTLTVLAPLSSMTTVNDMLTSLLCELDEGQKTLTTLKRIYDTLAKLEHYGSASLALSGLQEPVVPQIENSKDLRSLIQILGRTEPLVALPASPELPVEPQMRPTEKLQALIRQLAATEQVRQLGALVSADLTPPVLPETKELAMQLAKLERLAQDGKNLTADLKNVTADEALAEEKLHQLMDELGVCPACNSEFVKKEHAHA